MTVRVTIDERPCEAEEGGTILMAATRGGIYIPSLCQHPDLPPFEDLPLAERIYRGAACHQNKPTASEKPPAANNPQSAIRNPQSQGCGLCVVEVGGQPEPLRACLTPIADGMAIRTDTDKLRELRRTSLMGILARHPHACLTCAQREGCSLEDCSSNVPKEERCCSQFHDCELRKVAEYVGVKEQTPRYRPSGLPKLQDEPLYARDFDLCIDCARCVRACNQVRGVEALGIVQAADGLRVGGIAPTLIESGCKFCGACVEVCPTGCLTDKLAQAGDRERWLVPCVDTCPAALDVPGYIRAIARGDNRAAAAIVWEKLPLPNILGHICFHLCEHECRRGQLDDAIAICALKRFALETGDGELLAKAARPTDTGRKVVVIGAGPAGLSAACFLRFKGHAVTVLEAADRPGGMPALSIPAYRLPDSAVDRDTSVIKKLGVEIKTGQRLAADDVAGLLGRGYDAVLVAVGLPTSKKIPVTGSDLAGVHWGLEFLGAARAGQRFELGKDVVIIGGGNVAIDAAMTALRLSGGSVRMFCLESRAEMPAHEHEIAKAEAEGIEINCGWGLASITGSAGQVGGVELRRCTAAFDKQHKFAPVFDDEQRMSLDASAVILAIGQAPPDGVPHEGNGIFLAGDIAGPAGGGSAIQAVASGRAAAERIDRHLGGDGDVTLRLGQRPAAEPWIGREEGFAPRPRVSLPCAAADQRRADFRQIEGTYTPEDARAEAQRCLQCDLRLTIARPTLPPERWLQFDAANADQVPEAEGVLVLADSEKKPVVIKGTENLRATLLEKLEASSEASFFLWEEDRMYTKRESELIQQHMKRYGELPGGGDDELDDLF